AGGIICSNRSILGERGKAPLSIDGGIDQRLAAGGASRGNNKLQRAIHCTKATWPNRAAVDGESDIAAFLLGYLCHDSSHHLFHYCSYQERRSGSTVAPTLALAPDVRRGSAKRAYLVSRWSVYCLQFGPQ